MGAGPSSRAAGREERGRGEAGARCVLPLRLPLGAGEEEEEILSLLPHSVSAP